MATLDDVARIASELPEVIEDERHESRCWNVAGKCFAWERHFSKADLRRFGDEPPPDGPILAVRVADLAEKEAILEEHRNGFFTIPHFDGYTALLIQLTLATRNDLHEAIVDAWLACAPAKLAKQHRG